MKVMITGGTGFVGSHTVAALTAAGHDVRMHVRSRDKVEPALAFHGVAAPEVVVGDVTDPASVAEAIDGCDAVVHAANVFSFDPRDAEMMQRVNTEGTRLVLGTAADAGLDPVIHVSSYVALVPGTAPLTEESPAAVGGPPYAASKADAERIARSMQDQGAPVVTVYPGSVWGPGDPYLGESGRLAKGALEGKFRLLNDGNLPVSDVRDVARGIAAMVEAGKGPRRYFVIGHQDGFRDIVKRLGDVAGKNLWSIPVPNAMAMFAGRSADWARVRFGIDPALGFEGPWLAANGVEVDSKRAAVDLGLTYTPVEESMADTVRHLLDTGQLDAKHAPALS